MLTKRKHGEEETYGVTNVVESGIMMYIRRSDVPVFLQGGQLFKSFCTDDNDEEILVPNDVIKLDDSARTLSDVRLLLCSLRYWLVDSTPQSIVKYVLEHRARTSASVVQEFGKELPFLQDLQKVQAVPRKERMVVAYLLGNLEIIRFLYQQEGLEMVEQCASICAQHGYADCLQFYLSRIGFLPEGLERFAIEHGHLDCFKIVLSAGVPLTSSAAGWAIQFGNVTCLNYCLENGITPDSNFCTLAASEGSTACLKYLHEVAGCALTNEVCTIAVRAGHFECLVYAMEHGCPVSSQELAFAALDGKLAFLRYMHEHGVAFDNDFVTVSAVCNNHADCLQYVLEHGCPVDPRCILLASFLGHLRCLEILHQHGCPWSLEISVVATKNDQAECLKYAVEHGCPVVPQMLSFARNEGSVRCAAYLESVFGPTIN